MTPPPQPLYTLLIILIIAAICLLIVGIIWLILYLVRRFSTKKQLIHQAEETENLNTIGHLAASVAHEIRNPLTVVRGFMQIFSKEEFVPAEKKEYIQLMIRELDRAEKIINNYLSMAKPRAEIYEKIDLARQIQHVISIISSYGMLNDISIKAHCEDNLFVEGSKEKLNQVFINLLKNAIEASPHGSEISIASYRKKGNIYVDITDQGVGLTSEEIKRLGTPYYSTKKQGTGLGLMVSQGIVTSMGGKIEVQSEKEQGTTFSLVFRDMN